MNAKTSRGRFLRSLAKAAAIGLGAAIAPAAANAALLQSAHCCRSNCKSCGGSTPYAWTCTDCDGRTCCDCYSFDGTCRYQLGCGVCP